MKAEQEAMQSDIKELHDLFAHPLNIIVMADEGWIFFILSSISVLSFAP